MIRVRVHVGAYKESYSDPVFSTPGAIVLERGLLSDKGVVFAEGAISLALPITGSLEAKIEGGSKEGRGGACGRDAEGKEKHLKKVKVVFSNFDSPPS